MINPKSEIRNTKYDLEERTLRYAISIRELVKFLPKTLSNIEYSKQMIRSSASIGANYIEANESLGLKDFAMRIRICKKEAKETVYWLKLVETGTQESESLINEASELIKIFGAILNKFNQNSTFVSAK